MVAYHEQEPRGEFPLSLAMMARSRDRSLESGVTVDTPNAKILEDGFFADSSSLKIHIVDSSELVDPSKPPSIAPYDAKLNRSFFRDGAESVTLSAKFIDPETIECDFYLSNFWGLCRLDHHGAASHLQQNSGETAQLLRFASSYANSICSTPLVSAGDRSFRVEALHPSVIIQTFLTLYNHAATHLLRENGVPCFYESAAGTLFAGVPSKDSIAKINSPLRELPQQENMAILSTFLKGSVLYSDTEIQDRLKVVKSEQLKIRSSASVRSALL